MPSRENDKKTYCRQPWEGESDRYSAEKMFSQSCKAKFLSEPELVTEERKQMSLAPWEKGGVYVDDHDLENDNKIDDSWVVKYTPYNNVHVREAQLFMTYSTEMLMLAGQTGLGIKNANDTGGIATRFAEAGGKGSDRPGGLAFSFYQNFDKKWYTNPKTSKKTYHGPGDGTENNAARHTLWNMLNVHAVGFDMFGKISPRGLGAAKSVVDLHESNPDALKNKKMIFDPDDYKQSSSNPNDLNRRGCDPVDKPNECALKQADETTDLLNNQIGRNLGLQYPQGTSARDLALGMLDYFYSKGLYTIHKINEKYYVLRTKITKEQYDHMKSFYINQFDEHGKDLFDTNIYPFKWKDN